MMIRCVLLAVMMVASAGCGMLRLDIHGHAMAPTLLDGESALGTRRFDVLERGDIVGFRYPKDESKSFVKRIVGMPGERIESQAGRILIGGVALNETYVVDANRSGDTWGPVVLGAGEYFMLGDNRKNSSDSRHWGAVRREAIWAKVFD